MTKPVVPPRTLRGRFLLLALALLTFGPFGLAWYLARHPEWISKTSNYGELIIPPRPAVLDGLTLEPGSAEASIGELKNHWVLVQVASQGRCEAPCQEALNRSRQVWLRLSKDLPRVRRLLLFTANLDAAALQDLRQDDPTLLVARATPGLQQLFGDLALAEGTEATLWLLDPLGNVMMRYPRQYDPHGLLRDLQHLLKISQIG